MTALPRKLLPLTLLAVLLSLTGAHAADASKPLRALMVCGGCCHDYDRQKIIISEGVSARANVAWTIVQGGKERNEKLGVYANPDWAKGYDVIVHNECFGAVEDVAFVEGIAKPHFEGVPAVMLHCATHSYRVAKTDQWRQAIGQTSMSHEGARDLTIEVVVPGHPVMIGFPDRWTDPKDELYKNERLWPELVPLAQAYGVETKKNHVVIWANMYGKGKIFGTTLGHSNKTMEDPVYLDLVARGLLWVCDKLDENGKPKTGFGPAAVK